MIERDYSQQKGDLSTIYHIVRYSLLPSTPDQKWNFDWSAFLNPVNISHMAPAIYKVVDELTDLGLHPDFLAGSEPEGALLAVGTSLYSCISDGKQSMHMNALTLGDKYDGGIWGPTRDKSNAVLIEAAILSDAETLNKVKVLEKKGLNVIGVVALADLREHVEPEDADRIGNLELKSFFIAPDLECYIPSSVL